MDWKMGPHMGCPWFHDDPVFEFLRYVGDDWARAQNYSVYYQGPTGTTHLSEPKQAIRMGPFTLEMG